jgi:hypothetical protein
VTPRQAYLPIRHPVHQDCFCVFVRNHGVFWISGFLVFRMVDHPVLAKSWKSVGNAAFFCRGLVGLNPWASRVVINGI